MTGTLVYIPPRGSAFWLDAVATFAALPTAVNVGEARLTLDTGSIYYWTGSAWVLATAMGTQYISSVANTNSIHPSVSGGGQLTANLQLSAASADAGSFLSTVSIKADGLFIENPLAATAQTGILTSTDWNTFNNKVGSVANTNSIHLTKTGTQVTADLQLSAASADAGNFLSTVSIKTDGLFVENPLAATAQTGVLSSTDWNTFNGKIGGAGAANRVAYFSGSATLTSNANLTFDGTNATIGAGSAGINGRTDGSSAASGIIGEEQTFTQSSLTTTGIGSSAVYGSVLSFSVPAGEWDAFGVAQFDDNGATLTGDLRAGISSDSGGATLGVFDVTVLNAVVSQSVTSQMPTPRVTIRVSTTTTYYLNSRFSYTAGTPRHAGQVKIVRRR